MPLRYSTFDKAHHQVARDDPARRSRYSTELRYRGYRQRYAMPMPPFQAAILDEVFTFDDRRLVDLVLQAPAAAPTH